MAYKIETIEGIGPKFGKALRSVGIETTEDLLNLAGSCEGRESISETSGIPSFLVDNWTQMADLMRVAGIGEEYSELLNVAGVTSVQDLAGRDIDNLYPELEHIHDTQNIVRNLPKEKEVKKWIKSSATMKEKYEECESAGSMSLMGGMGFVWGGFKYILYGFLIMLLYYILTQ